MRAFLSKNKVAAIYVILAAATILSFWQVNYSSFIDLDDKNYIHENTHILNGVTTEGITWAFCTVIAGAHWHPLTWISHMLDVQFFGLDPQWHHLINLLFHIANTVLLFFVLHRMTKALWRSAFVAALFALHPLHVEPVAWLASRKDVLSTLFWVLTMTAYSYYVQKPNAGRYAAVLVFFALGLMAKPMLVTLPFVLLILDYWPLDRFNQNVSMSTTRPNERKGKSENRNRIALAQETGTKKAVSAPRWNRMLPLLWEKTPLLVLSLFSSIVAYIGQQMGGSVGSLEHYPLSLRIENTFVSYISYIEKMLWPGNLAVFYPYQKWSLWQVFGAIFIFALITCVAIWMAKRVRYLIAGWLWYVGTLVPVIGLVQVGDQAVANRYTYVPLVGLFIIVSWGIPEIVGKWRYGKSALAITSISALLCLSVATWIQVGYWQNDFTLFGRAVEVVENNYSAYLSLGNAYAGIGRPERAIEEYDRAIKVKPGYALAYHNRGSAYASLNDQRRAIEDYDKAILLNPLSSTAFNSRGNAYGRLGDMQRAIKDYTRAIEINPAYAWAYANRGAVYGSLGNLEQAMIDFSRAIEIDPKLTLAYRNRAELNNILGNKEQAYRDLKAAALLGDKVSQGLPWTQGLRR